MVVRVGFFSFVGENVETIFFLRIDGENEVAKDLLLRRRYLALASYVFERIHLGRDSDFLLTGENERALSVEKMWVGSWVLE